MPEQPETLYAIAERLSVIALLLAVVWALATQRLVPISLLLYERSCLLYERKEKERAQALCERLLATASNAVTVIEKVVPRRDE